MLWKKEQCEEFWSDLWEC